MRKIIYILIITIFLNFFMLSFGYSQNGVNVTGVVPLTDANRNVSPKTKIQLQKSAPVYKENKYLYYFEKGLGLVENQDSANNTAQTRYDLIASKLLLWGILLVLAAILWAILGLMDRLIFGKKTKLKLKHAH